MMLFTGQARLVIDRAKDIAVSRAESTLTPTAILSSVVLDRRAATWLAQAVGLDPVEFRTKVPLPEIPKSCHGRLPLASETREMLSQARGLAEETPVRSRAGLIGLPHIVAALAVAFPASERGRTAAASIEELRTLLESWLEADERPLTLGDLTSQLRGLRAQLERRIVGQDHAIGQFVDGLFHIGVVGAADTDRRKPAGLFVFAGPPGVGKTFLAELGAGYLDRPFKRFDMTAYADRHHGVGLAGSPKVWRGAAPGAMTQFAKENPNGILLFDEIEKAHLETIHLFLQLLDAGHVQDMFTEEEIPFRDTIVIFTTNAGRSLYENENMSGVSRANAGFHRATILDALRTERNPATREPFFPAALCSRLATGHPILFNHLQVHDLARVAADELSRVSGLLSRQHGQRYEIGPHVPLALVMREGARTDARTIKAQAEGFLKDEMFGACRLFADERIDAALGDVITVCVDLDEQHAGEVAERIFSNQERPVVIFAGEPDMGRALAGAIPEVGWRIAGTGDHVLEAVAKESVDFVLLDLALREQAPVSYGNLSEAFHDVSAPTAGDTVLGAFDHSPLTARRFTGGQRLLERLHVRSPETPVFLASFEQDRGRVDVRIDDELLLACMRAGGARGVIRMPSQFTSGPGVVALRERVLAIAQRLRMERRAEELATRSEVVAFDTTPAVAEGGRTLRIRCRNFRLVRAVRGDDTSELLSEVERPSTTFADVIGAAAAKEGLSFIRDWLREPKKYAASGVEAPRGFLLTGPPGTGKTMLARALAGEADCAFLATAATSFVTMWQGSGPQNVRDLFARARRYAPSIVFIDEIDAVGKARQGVAGAGRAQEETLNALLVEMDGFQRPNRPVIVLAATNLGAALDPALRRRFGREIEVELPTRLERLTYLQARLAARSRHQVSAEMLERIGTQSAGLTIADLERIMSQAAIMAFANNGLLDNGILGEAFEKVTLGERKPNTDPVRTAQHEAGHALVMCLVGRPPVYVTVVGRSNFGGYVAPDDREDRSAETRSDLEDFICVLLGGREAERLLNAEAQGDSTGPSDDLKRASRLAEDMVYEFGMAEEIGFVHIDRQRPLSGGVAERCHAAVRRIIEGQSTRASRMLQEHRETLDRVVAELLGHERLLKEELLALLTPQERRLVEGAGLA